MTDAIRVLHVDDEPEFADLTATYLEREDERFTVETATSGAEGLEQLTDEVDCVVSDYEMPGMNGIEFLETVRETYSDVPFVLFTGKGSEAVASDAISAGVTDYLRKRPGTEQYELLATRIDTAVGQYRAENELERMTDLFDQTQDIADIGAWEIDLRTDEGWWTEQVSHIYGLPPDYEHDPGEGVEYFHPEDRPTIREALDRAIEEGEPYDLELRVVGADDTIRWVHAKAQPQTENGDVVRVRGTLQDITDRKERERELEVTKRRLDAILEHTTTPMFMKDDGRYIFVNRSYREVFDIDEEIAGKTAHDVHPPERADRIEADDRTVLENGEALEFEERATLDGETRTFLTTVVPIYDTGEQTDSEEPVALFGVASDITTLKRRENELERERDRLDEFASIISHDLRNPLNVATTRLELASDECDSEHLDDVADALDRMSTLIGNVLTLAREGEPTSTLESVVLADIGEACWETVATENASLVVDTDATVRADRSRLQQLLENLMHNAVEHSSTSPDSQTRQDSAERHSAGSRTQSDDAVEHGTTSNRTRSDDAVEHGGVDVTITIGDLDDGFYVADDGPGIPIDEREKVFESGYSTAEDGTGFGLAIVQEIAEAHGWDVGVSESADGGARIEITDVSSHGTGGSPS